MRILILGDCHGHLDRVREACVHAQARFGIEAAIQVGDFGFFPKIITAFLQDRPRFPIPLHVIDGNHEDHGWLHTSRSQGGCATWAHANLYFHPRSTVSMIGDCAIGFLGGALHADRRQTWAGQWKPATGESTSHRRRRVPPDPEWANWVTDKDVERALAAFKEVPPDLLISHSCPAGIGIGMVGAQSLIADADRFITRAGHYAGPFTDCGEGGLTRLWRAMPHRPQHWLFGHYHALRRQAIDRTTFVCVGSTDDTDGSPGIRPIIYDTLKRTLDIGEGHLL